MSGFDVPDCECVLLLRATQSLTLYIQSSTRCLRPNGDKKSIIIDMTRKRLSTWDANNGPSMELR